MSRRVARLLDRRGFLAHTILGAASLAIFPAPAASVERRRAMRIFVALPEGIADPSDGATFGAEEARATAALLKGTIEVTRVPSIDALREAIGTDGQLAAIVAGYNESSASALAEIARRVSVPMLTTASWPRVLRRSACDAPVFHMVPDADADAHVAGDADGARVMTWHPSLFRYGAEQLNDRFRARFRRGMTGDAWTAWMAFKVLGDALFRSRATTNAELVAWLSSPRARFDGHKGVPLRFDEARELLQPLYLVSRDDKVLRELPIPAEGQRGCGDPG